MCFLFQKQTSAPYISKLSRSNGPPCTFALHQVSKIGRKRRGGNKNDHLQLKFTGDFTLLDDCFLENNAFFQVQFQNKINRANNSLDTSNQDNLPR